MSVGKVQHGRPYAEFEFKCRVEIRCPKGRKSSQQQEDAQNRHEAVAGDDLQSRCPVTVVVLLLMVRMQDEDVGQTAGFILVDVS